MFVLPIQPLMRDSLRSLSAPGIIQDDGHEHRSALAAASSQFTPSNGPKYTCSLPDQVFRIGTANGIASVPLPQADDVADLGVQARMGADSAARWSDLSRTSCRAVQ
jgi:hypothetical protein